MRVEYRSNGFGLEEPKNYWPMLYFPFYGRGTKPSHPGNHTTATAVLNMPFHFSLMHHDTRPSPLVRCRLANENDVLEASKTPDHRSEARLRIDPKVLVFVETTYSRLGRDIAELLVYNRIK